MRTYMRLRTRHNCLVAVTLVLLPLWVGSAAVGGSQETGPPAAVVLVMLPSAGPPVAGLSRIIAGAADLELRRNGVRSLVFDLSGAPEDGLLGADGTLRTEDVLADSRAAGTSRVLALRYAVDGETISLKLSVHDAAGGRLLAESATRGTLGLELDALVSAGIRDLGNWFPRPPEKRPAAAEGETVPPPGSDRSPSLADGASLTEDPTERLGAETPLTAIRPVGAQLPAPRMRRLQADARGAPLLPIGPASTYLQTGVVTSLFAGYRIPALSDVLSLGLHLGVDRFQARGSVTSSTNTLVPFGIEAHLQFENSGLLNASASIAGGAALLAFSPPDGEALLKIVPFLYAGVGLSALFAGVAGPGVEVGCQIFFECSCPIVAFTPSGLLRLRF